MMNPESDNEWLAQMVSEREKQKSLKSIKQQPGQPHFQTLANLYEVKSISQLQWGHAVNSLLFLNKLIQDNEAQLFEVDIRTAIGSDNLFITSHDPCVEGDSFEEWVGAVMSVNQNKHRKYGMKLDFKDVQCVIPCLKFLAEISNNIPLTTPLILNADILAGPSGSSPAFNHLTFISSCLEYFPNCILSLGWTTQPSEPLVPPCHRSCSVRACNLLWFTGGREVEEEKVLSEEEEKKKVKELEGKVEWQYTNDMVSEMLAVCREFSLTQVTFPVRACNLPSSVKTLHRLLSFNPNYTLTIFDQSGDFSPSVKWICAHFPPTRLFIDLKNE